MIDLLKMRARQGLRLSRLAANLVSGSAFIQAVHQFPSLSKVHERELNDYRLFSLWVEDLVRSMNSVTVVKGHEVMDAGLFASNHISWLDTIVFNNLRPSGFIARHDLETWPLLGTFTRRMGSIYIDRSNKFQAYRSIPKIEERLRQGGAVHLFPESTTSDGLGVMPFYPMFYEAAVRVGSWVQPVALRYTDAQGGRISEPAFIGEDSFLDTLERILKVDKIFAHVTYCTPLDGRSMSRKELAFRSRQSVIAALGL